MPAGSSWLRIQAVSASAQAALITSNSSWCLGGLVPATVVDDQVVADAALLVEQHRVAGLAGADAKQIGGQRGPAARLWRQAR